MPRTAPPRHRPPPVLRVARALAWAGLACVASAREAPAGPQPNVVLIVSDDQAWTDYGFMGHPAIETPRLDRLADESLTFTRGYSPNSLCSPSLASLITGLYPHQHGVVGNDPPKRVAGPGSPRADPATYARRRERLIAKIDGAPTLPRLLAARGYGSFQSGKWWLGSYARGGFTDGMTRGFPEPGGRHGDDGLRIGREGVGPLVRFMEAAVRDETPFFVWYAPLLPHTPHNPPERILRKYVSRAESEPIARYYAMCEWFDETCGEVLDAIDHLSVADNTIVVYATDNGWINRADRSAYAPRSKRSPYDAGLRTPILIRWPEEIEPRRDERTLVSTLDVAPTILAACGAASPAALPGVDLLDGATLRGRGQLFGEVFAHDVADLDSAAESLFYRWTIEGRWKLIAPHTANRPGEAAELYDVLADPHEMEEMADRQADVVQRLSEGLDAWWDPAVDTTGEKTP